eukprot:3821197-Rhodomonas_salina.1
MSPVVPNLAFVNPVVPVLASFDPVQFFTLKPMPRKDSLLYSPAFPLSINCTSKQSPSKDEEEEVDIAAVDERARQNIEVMQDLTSR